MEKLKMVENTSTFDLIIPKYVEGKIRHLCSVVHDVEWSGTLFYKVNGTFQDNNVSIECLDIFVMDIGSSTYTEFNDCPDIVTYRVQHPELLQEGVYEGLVHSHNNMSTFFSATDSSTLIEEGTDKNHFLSLIVNNAGQYTARITRKIDKKSKIKAHIESISTTSFDTYNGDTVILSENVVKSEDKEDLKITSYIEYYNLNIVKETTDNDFSEVDARLQEIKQKKRNTKPVTSYTSAYYDWYNKSKPSTNPNNILYVEDNKKDNLFSQSSKNTYDWYKDYSELDGWNYYKDMHDVDTVKSGVDSLSDYIDKSAKTTAARILSGSIMADEETANSVYKWINTIDSKYAKIFDDKNHAIDNWLEVFIHYCIVEYYSEDDSEFVTNYNKDDEEFIDEDIITCERAHVVQKIISEWEKFLTKDSKVIDSIYENLETYKYYDV